jgi:hypothetical protein
MICETCHGTGHLLQQWAPTVLAELPCPECSGSGITSCCDGACGGPGNVPGIPVQSPHKLHAGYRPLRRTEPIEKRTPPTKERR